MVKKQRRKEKTSRKDKRKELLDYMNQEDM